MSEEVTYTYTRSSKGGVETSTTGYRTAAGAVSQSSQWNAKSGESIKFPKDQHGENPYFSHSATCTNGATLGQNAARKLYADIGAELYSQTTAAGATQTTLDAISNLKANRSLTFAVSNEDPASPPALIKAACDKAKAR